VHPLQDYNGRDGFAIEGLRLTFACCQTLTLLQK
jgi:hypothetical protein